MNQSLHGRGCCRLQTREDGGGPGGWARGLEKSGRIPEMFRRSQDEVEEGEQWGVYLPPKEGQEP